MDYKADSFPHFLLAIHAHHGIVSNLLAVWMLLPLLSSQNTPDSSTTKNLYPQLSKKPPDPMTAQKIGKPDTIEPPTAQNRNGWDNGKLVLWTWGQIQQHNLCTTSTSFYSYHVIQTKVLWNWIHICQCPAHIDQLVYIRNKACWVFLVRWHCKDSGT